MATRPDPQNVPTPILLALIVVFSLLTSHALHRYAHGRIVLSGVEYLLIGAVVGPLGLGLLSSELIDTLEPLLFVVLGVVGFSLGLPLRRWFRGAGALLPVGLLSAVLVVAIVGSFAFVALTIADLTPQSRLWVALTFGAAAAAVSRLTIDLTAAYAGAHGPATHLLRVFAVAGNIVAVFVAGTALAVRRATDASNRLGLTETEWLVAAVGLGVASGVLFRFFVGKHPQADDRTFLATVGVVTFTSGIAAAANMSPLFLGAVAGVTVSMLSSIADEIERTFARLERPALAVLVIFAGAMWVPVHWVVFVIAGLYFGSRVFAVKFASFVALRTNADLPRVDRPGEGLLAQGSLAIAIAVTFAQVYPGEASVVLAVVLTSALFGDLYASRPLARLLADAGETAHVSQEAR